MIIQEHQAHADRALHRAIAYSAGLLAIAALPLLFPGLLSDYGFEIGFRLLVLLTLAEAWNLLAGYGGMVSLGTASFVGIGGYILTGLMNAHGMPALAALLCAAVGGAMLAALVSRAVFRLKGLYFTVGTLAMSEALRLYMINSSVFGGATGWIASLDPPSIQVLYGWAWGLFAVATAVLSLYVGSRLSIALKAVRDDEAAAIQVGVRAFRVKVIAFMVASALMAAAGALQGLKLGAIEPYGMFGISWSIAVLSTVIIGGIGLRLGPLVGALFVVALSEGLADYPDVHIALTGVILIVVIRFAPRGLVGLLLSALRKWPGALPVVRHKTANAAQAIGKES
jgi:branched-chain amino acid transport system permease protein